MKQLAVGLIQLLLFSMLTLDSPAKREKSPIKSGELALFPQFDFNLSCKLQLKLLLLNLSKTIKLLVESLTRMSMSALCSEGSGKNSLYINQEIAESE